jgi:branched-chain amino acid transport system ATP-binding protein
MPSESRPILAVTNIEATYDNAILALRSVSLAVTAGEVVALLGSNGAGKTTTLKAISNLLVAERGQITRGSISYDGASTARLTAADLVQQGLVPVLEGRHCFAHLTVEENLITGALARRTNRAAIRTELERIYNFLPRLKEKRRTLSGLTSGGEQQMTAIGRALMAQPRLLILDEPSMGLAPIIAAEIFEFIKRLKLEGDLSILVAEQNSVIALRYADRAYILENGHVVMDGVADVLRDREEVKHFYLGAGGDRRRGSSEWRMRRSESWLN